MPPQTRPVDARFAELAKAAAQFAAQSKKDGTANTRQQRSAQKSVDKALSGATQHIQKQNKLLAQQSRLIQKNVSLFNKMRGGGGAGPGGEGGGKTNLAGAMGMRKWMGPAAVASIVGSVVGLVSSQVRASIDTFSGTVKTQRDVAGMISDRKITALTRGAAPLGFGPQEVLGAVQGVGRAVGVRRPGDFPAGGVAQLLKAQQQYGISTQEGTGLMGAVRQAGIKDFDVDAKGQRGAGLRTFQRIMAEGVASGLEKTRVPEHMANVSKGMQMVGENISGVVDAQDISAMMASLGTLGAGFQGKRGAGVMNAFQSMFASVGGGGGGDLQALMLQDVGGFGGPGSKNSFFGARKQLDKGFNTENVNNMVQGIVRRYGVGEMGALALSAASGGKISATKAETLVKAGSKGFAGQAELDAAIREAIPDTLDTNEKALSLAAKQAQVQLQQFEMGKQLLDVVLNIQVLIGQLVEGAVPAIKAMLMGIEELISSFKEGLAIIKDLLPDSTKQKSGATQLRMQQIQSIREELPANQQVAAFRKLLQAQTGEVENLQGLQASPGARGSKSAAERALIQKNRILRKDLPGAVEAQEDIQSHMNRAQSVVDRRARLAAQAKAEVEHLTKQAKTRTDEAIQKSAESLAEAALEAKNLFRPFDALAKATEDTAQRTGGQPEHVSLGDDANQ